VVWGCRIGLGGGVGVLVRLIIVFRFQNTKLGHNSPGITLEILVIFDEVTTHDVYTRRNFQAESFN
jgi:hypothetical protein